ncbi:MAG: hypothetical protein BWY88_00220 [Synergistetes bacterium ADurb.Bin520]|nr:MAG: hypothetical protein BWY88_00220 [Synergistetes bacterium ADurb.Bin520]
MGKTLFLSGQSMGHTLRFLPQEAEPGLQNSQPHGGGDDPLGGVEEIFGDLGALGEKEGKLGQISLAQLLNYASMGCKKTFSQGLNPPIPGKGLPMAGHMGQEGAAEADHVSQRRRGFVDPRSSFGGKSLHGGRGGIGVSGQKAPVTVHIRVDVFCRIDDYSPLVPEGQIAVASGALQHQRAPSTDSGADGAFEEKLQHAVMPPLLCAYETGPADMGTQRQKQRTGGFSRALQIRHAMGRHSTQSGGIRMPCYKEPIFPVPTLEGHPLPPSFQPGDPVRGLMPISQCPRPSSDQFRSQGHFFSPSPSCHTLRGAQKSSLPGTPYS